MMHSFSTRGESERGHGNGTLVLAVAGSSAAHRVARMRADCGCLGRRTCLFVVASHACTLTDSMHKQISSVLAVDTASTPPAPSCTGTEMQPDDVSGHDATT